MIKLLLFTFVFAFCSMNVAATFYIDRINGADGNDGLSPETAWQSVEKVNETTFSPGDSILFKRGQVWFNQLKITSQGTEEQPVFFGAFGSGGKPRFNAQDVINHAIYITNASYVHLRDLVAYDSKNTGIPIAYSHHILLRGVDALFSGDWEQGGGPGIVASRESHHVVIDSATVIKSVNNGIYIGSSPNQKTMVNNVTISNSYVSQTKFNDCIVVHEGSPYDGTWLVGDDIVFRNNYAELSGNEEGYDVTAGNSVLLENNISYGNPQGGIAVGHSAKNVVIKNHISYGEPSKSSTSPQILIGGTWGKTSNYEVSGSLFLHSQGYMLIVANKDVRVFNNTFIWSGERGDGILVRTPADSVVFKNNIFTTRGDYIGRTTFLLSGNPLPPRYVFDNNIYYPPDNFMFFNSTKTKFYDFEAWQTAMKQDSHSVAIDPQLVDIAGGDYRLLPTSPAIDTLAADVRTGQWDILGTLIPYGDGPDVGALEYNPDVAGFVIPTPAAPTELTAANTSPGIVELNWVDNSDNEFGFRIDRSQDGKTFEFVDIVDPDMTSYTDTTVTTEQQEYQYHVRAYNNRGNSEASNTASVVTAVRNRQATTAPSQFQLYGNYPNPFNPSTNIAFELPESGRVVLAIYNVLGEKITTLLDKKLTAGPYTIAWDARDQTGDRVSSGMYLYRIQFEEQVKTDKMLFMQ